MPEASHLEAKPKPKMATKLAAILSKANKYQYVHDPAELAEDDIEDLPETVGALIHYQDLLAARIGDLQAACKKHLGVDPIKPRATVKTEKQEGEGAKPQQENNTPRTPRPRKCYGCGATTHLRRDCPDPKPPKKSGNASEGAEERGAPSLRK